MTKQSEYLIKPLVLAISLAASTNLIAQELRLEEVVVTAQKREQSMQGVPVAITALSSDSLKNAGVQTIEDVERLSPNTQLRASRATNTTLTAYIRGIGQNDPLWGFEPGVGLYIDDVYFARPQGAMLDVYDIERIEVLRGPQGSLYGKNTIGGAIKYVTKKIATEPEASIDVALGSYNQKDLTVSASLPLVADKVYLGATIAQFKRDGYGTNAYTNGENYNKDLTAGRLTLEFTPSDELFIRLAGDYTEDTSNNRHGSRLTPSMQTGEAPHDAFDSNAGAGDDQEVKNSGANLVVEWDVSDRLTVKSTTAYREGSTRGFIDFDATPVNTFDAPVRYDDDQFTQEFQINYTVDGLAVVGGLFYMDGNAEGAFDAIAGAALGGPAQEPVNAVPSTFVAYTEGAADTKSKAAYVQANLDLSEALTLTVGGRYTQDKKDATVYKSKLFTDGTAGGASSNFGGGDLAVLVVQSDFEDGDSWSKFNPRVGLDWQMSEDTLVYASYAEGFKSGGINMRADVTASPAGFSHVFEPEDAKSIELGIKSEFMDNRIRLNAAVFRTKYDNVQITQTQLVGINFVPVVSTDNTEVINGLEAELTAQLTNNFSVVANLGLIDAEWDKFIDGLTGNDVGDMRSVSNVPETSGMVGINYDTEVTDGTLTFSTSLSYTGAIAMEVAIPDQPIDEDSYTLWNASVNWVSTDEHWNVGLHARNLSDTEYRVAGYNFPNFLGDDEILGFYGAPRTVTLKVGYQF